MGVAPDSDKPFWYRVVQRVYEGFVVDKLPDSYNVYNGVVVRDGGFLDLEIRHECHKEGLIDAIEENVRGKDVVLVALGKGVSTVTAVRSGARSVTAYEGSSEMIELAEETLDVNLSEVQRNMVEVEHAIVGEAISLFGDGESDRVVNPSELPECDVLILDCEGAELSILDGIEEPPETIICETHPDKLSFTPVVREKLKGLGYDVDSRQYERGWDDRKRVLTGEMPGKN